MSETKTKLTEKQRAWAQAFLRAMGMKPDLDVDIVPETEGNKLKGRLNERQDSIDRSMEKSLKSDEVRGKGEKVGRGLLGSGKGYKQDVIDKVDTLLKKADEFVRAGSLGDEVKSLIGQLEEAKEGYDDRLEGETSKSKKDQRNRKIEAIDKRVEALRGILMDAEQSRFSDLNYMEDKTRIEELVANPAILDVLVKKGTDPKTMATAVSAIAEKNPRAFGTYPDLFAVYLERNPPAKTIVDLMLSVDITTAEKLVDLTLIKYKSDSAMQERICQVAVARELADSTSIATFFRGNSVATKSTKALAVMGDESKEYLNDLNEVRNATFDGMPESLELDPKKVPQTVLDHKLKKEVKVDPEKMIKESVDYLGTATNTILSHVFNSKVSANIAKTSYMIADAATKKGMQRDEVAIMIGGHLLLRIINPALISAPKAPKVPMAGNEKRMMILLTKIVQNIANHILVAEKGKEEYMSRVVPIVKAHVTPMTNWCFAVADEGRVLLGL